MKERVIWVDWAKAIGICLVVLGHYMLPNTDVRGYIFMFHMPLFFFCFRIPNERKVIEHFV